MRRRAEVLDRLPARDRLAIFAYGLGARIGLFQSRLGSSAFRIAYDAYKSLTDRNILEFVRRQTSPGDAVVDVGAHLGFYTVRMARLVGPSGRVVAFEPERRTAETLRRRLSREGLSNVIVREVALADRPGDIDLYLGRIPADTRAYLHPAAGEHYPVAANTLEDELGRLSIAPVLVKIDVQGYEVRVLRGMGRLLSDQRLQALVMEFWPAALIAAGDDPAEVFRVCERSSLRPATFSGGGALAFASPASLLAACDVRGYLDIALVRA